MEYRAGKSPPKGLLKMFLFRHDIVLVMALFVGSLSCSIPARADAVNQPGHNLKPQLGMPASVSVEVASPDGSGLPQGSGTVAAGKRLYDSRCAACHGTDGQQPGNQLVGGIGSLATNSPFKTVGSFWPYATTLFDYIARSMPYDEQKSLTADETYAVTAYVLNLNGILDEAAILHERNLPGVKMPNRAGFVELIQ